ncbi:MAG TPA: zinc ABC transporter substrate-binding protein [Amaricoccus sp.]|nr:zinc ABC transporter substrate-binding protein [Amaricoccus sp.]HMQ92550.1 zinc ABC transporter substrate-binding protein [Amaricoccus sp.]HMR52103.1 zinc ABC transporter substrate-binding protein [Amaricoccus sp.]HMR60134.1 zinc ABC transporter substrate-binding protein [Amaricoccus sp.]HMT98905.1 zinc ABC transporter substrate-binding protein [Amaricoccus sp.]
MATRAVAAALALAAMPGAAAASPPVVATDIAPVQSIVARVMAGVGAPGLVVPPGASPHGYALRPSEAELLQEAGLVVWVGPALDPWLAGPIDTLAAEAARVTLQDAPGIRLLPIRSGGPFEPHEHDHGQDHGQAGEAADHDHDHDHGTEAADADHDHDHEHEHGGPDGHLWLDPGNAVAAARAVAAALAPLDPENAAAYAANAEAFATEMAELSSEIEDRLAPVRGQRFIVFHDAYQYFEDRFDMPAAGSVSLQEGVAPGAARVAEIHDRVRDAQISCAFTEPQFEPKLLGTVIEGAGVRTDVLDPIGAALPPGPDLYPALMLGLADSLAECLGG